MSNPRTPYVKPEVLQFEYQVDPRVTLAVTCKDFLSGSGPVVAGCKDTLGGACQDTPPS